MRGILLGALGIVAATFLPTVASVGSETVAWGDGYFLYLDHQGNNCSSSTAVATFHHRADEGSARLELVACGLRGFSWSAGECTQLGGTIDCRREARLGSWWYEYSNVTLSPPGEMLFVWVANHAWPENVEAQAFAGELSRL